MSEEIMKTETTAMANTMGTDFFDELAEEMEGLGDISFDVVKVPSGGGLAFEVPGDEPDNPDMMKELRGVIVARQATNGYWPDAFGSGDKAPVCYSPDGKTGVVAETGECRDCASCPHNQFKADGSGKDCKNMQNLYLVPEGAMFPLRVVLPPTSIRNLKEYISKRLMFKGKKLSQVITSITLSKAESKDGIKYAVANFARKADLTPEQAAEYEPIRELVKSIIAKQCDFSRQAAPAAEGAYEEVTDEPIPF